LTSIKNTIVVEDVPAMESPLQLQVGDILEVYKTDIEGEQASYDESGNVLVPSKISCTEPAVIKSLEEGQLIFFDDGKITGEVVRKHEEKVDVKITNAKVTGSKLKADKGINVPFSDIKFSGITEKDKEDLKFVAVHADMVNLSFVNTPEDVYELLDELKKVNAKKELGLVLKIETQAAYNNIFDILIAAMETYPIGVMIARGDLAIETGWNHIGIVQKEILSFCNAAHIPVIWATQVLENLAKKGLPSRSEITDAVTAIKADCVMLNKGPYISRAVGLLDDILTIQQAYQFKNAPYTPELEKF
jgi:pyruvate kinase